MTEAQINKLVTNQRKYFYENHTLSVSTRIDALKKLKACILKYEKEINEALKSDLGKCDFESYMCEVGMVLSELSYMIKHTRRYAKPQRDPSFVAVVNGGRAENTCLLNEHFDYIFFTGSKSVGKEVMRCASAHLTPVTLELGGKSPCIVEESANIKLAAKRIVWGKFLNCGQTCVAPDYIYCHKSIKEQLIKEIKLQIKAQFGESPLDNPEYGKIINAKHFERILRLIEPSKVVTGGESDPATLRIAPTVMDNVTWEDAVMQEEIFGPLLPILTYDSLNETIQKINSMEHPLALYIFTCDNKVADTVTSQCGFGGGCINDCIIHLATSEMGFGGFGESGMGSYHGKHGFDTFTHYKSIVNKKNWIDLPMRYQPFKAFNSKLLHAFLR